jgi:hypothetical protein
MRHESFQRGTCMVHFSEADTGFLRVSGTLLGSEKMSVLTADNSYFDDFAARISGLTDRDGWLARRTAYYKNKIRAAREAGNAVVEETHARIAAYNYYREHADKIRALRVQASQLYLGTKSQYKNRIKNAHAEVLADHQQARMTVDAQFHAETAHLAVYQVGAWAKASLNHMGRLLAHTANRVANPLWYRTQTRKSMYRAELKQAGVDYKQFADASGHMFQEARRNSLAAWFKGKKPPAPPAP